MLFSSVDNVIMADLAVKEVRDELALIAASFLRKTINQNNNLSLFQAIKVEKKKIRKIKTTDRIQPLKILTES